MNIKEVEDCKVAKVSSKMQVLRQSYACTFGFYLMNIYTDRNNTFK
jgi:hypothetical protein